MCGRYVDNISPDEFRDMFGCLPHEYENRKQFDIRPTDEVGVLRQEDDGLVYELMSWMLVPARAETRPLKTFNACSETVRKRVSYSGPFLEGQRCLIPCSGYLEWRDGQRHFLHPKKGAVWALAGLWDINTKIEDEPIVSCTMMTTVANEVTRKVHPDRMPVILAEESFDTWLNASADKAEALLRPCPGDWIGIEPEVLELF